ncbi:MAG: PIG-L family deacetylase [Victivallaceae bacterium]|nr:PIG-L family deacetylase [Victivallaceae bacterium]
MAKRAFAVCAHPDDIEFMMAGTLIRLQELGYEVHYMTIANGALGGNMMSWQALADQRMQEAMNACKVIGAIYHPPVTGDLEVFYNFETLAKVVKVMREVDPEIVLTHGPYDYMEDHTCAGRLAVSAAFARGMGNFRTVSVPPVDTDVAVYHSVPLSLKDQLNRPVIPELFVDVTSTMEKKKAMLSCHVTQKQWLDESQKLNAYIDDMVDRAAFMGKRSGFCDYAEGWNRHNPCGFCAEDFDPLSVIARPAKA